MDLMDNKIKMKELLADKRAKEIITRELPQFATPVLLSISKHMTLEDVLKRAVGHVPKSKTDAVLNMLREL